MRAKTEFLHNFVFATALAQRTSVTKLMRAKTEFLPKHSFGDQSSCVQKLRSAGTKFWSPELRSGRTKFLH